MTALKTLKLSDPIMVRPINNEADYEDALAEIDKLMGNVTRGTPEGERYDMLVSLVEAYEEKHYPIGIPEDPIGMIEFVLEQRGLARKDLIPILGNRQRVYDVMNKKRRLTLDMIRKLDAELGIPAEVLIQKYELAV